MAPYRKAPHVEAPGRAKVGDDRLLGGMLLVVGGLRLVIAIIGREVFEAEATIALLMVVLGMAMWVRGK